MRFLILLLVALTLPAAASAEKRLTPSWMQIDSARKRVTMPLVAGWSPFNGALNFNGYHSGNATVVVPAGWNVVLKFKNNDGMLPHSVVVTRAYAEKEMPLEAGLDQTAIPRAYSIDPVPGIMAPRGDDVPFLARDPGQYLLYCGVTGHGQAGMWVRFDVVAGATAPELVIADGTEPGWE
jgi:sulfocyanin